MSTAKQPMIDTREVVSTFVPLYARGKTLDIGGGTSKYRETIKKHVSEYIVSDLFEAAGVDVIADIRHMSFEDKSFDTVLSFQVLEHVDDTRAAVHEIHRVLKKGGCAIVTAPFINAQHGDPSDFHRFTPEGLRWYFDQAGFETVELGKQGSTFSVISELMRFVFLNPYKSHGRVRKAMFDRIFKLLKSFDRRGWLQSSSLFTNVYIVARK